MNIAWLISALGMMVGACIGLALVFHPRLVRPLIRTETVPVEVRNAFGAGIVAIHLLGLLFLGLNWGYADPLFGAINAGVAAAAGAIWFGACAGRLFTLWREKRLGQWRACVFEAGLGVWIAAPWLLWIVVAVTA